MEIKVLSKDDNGYVTAEVRDGENYLNYLYTPTRGWDTVYGQLNGRGFKRGDLRGTWRVDRRGAASGEAWELLTKLDNYFYDNAPAC